MKYLIIIIIISGLFFYLNRSYAAIYNQINSADLKNPHQQEVFIGRGPENVTVAALGDSLAAGVGANSYENSLVYLLTKDISENNHTGVKLINLAVPGSTSEDVLKSQIQKLDKIKPQYIILLVGTNDVHNLVSPSHFKNNYSKILISLKGLQPKAVFILNIPYLGSPDLIKQPYPAILSLRIRQFNGIIQELSQQNSFTYIDVYGKTSKVFKTDPSQYSRDGFHPSDKGYNTIANTIHVSLLPTN